MCYFITVAVPMESIEAARREVPRGFHAGVGAMGDNASLTSTLPSGYGTFVLTSGGCSCGMYQRELPERIEPSPDHLRGKFAKKGWSASKIERAVKQAALVRPRPVDFLGYRSDVIDIYVHIAAKVAKFAVLVHFVHKARERPIPLGQHLHTVASRLHEVIPNEDQWLWIEDG